MGKIIDFFRELTAPGETENDKEVMEEVKRIQGQESGRIGKLEESIMSVKDGHRKLKQKYEANPDTEKAMRKVLEQTENKKEIPGDNERQQGAG